MTDTELLNWAEEWLDEVFHNRAVKKLHWVIDCCTPNGCTSTTRGTTLREALRKAIEAAKEPKA